METTMALTLISPRDATLRVHDDDIAETLHAASLENDPAALLNALRAIIATRSMAQLTQATGLTRAGIHKALTAGGNPSFSTVAKIAHALGVRLELVQVRHSMASRRARPTG